MLDHLAFSGLPTVVHHFPSLSSDCERQPYYDKQLMMVLKEGTARDKQRKLLTDQVKERVREREREREEETRETEGEREKKSKREREIERERERERERTRARERARTT